VGLKEMLCDCVDGTYLNSLPMVIYWYFFLWDLFLSFLKS
jgi:hypothetical protein